MENASRLIWFALVGALAGGCDDGADGDPDPDAGVDAGPVEIAEGIFGAAGEPFAFATEAQRATFERGEQVARRRFTPEEGLGPHFNVSFCGACHEKPVFGGSAGRYRNFAIVGETLDDGSFFEGNDRGGVATAYGDPVEDPRPVIEADLDVQAWRTPIPFFGVGLIAELSDEAILINEDPDDMDGDGISGKANFSDGFIGRFGRKSQTANVEGFIRGPLNNHLGITSDPLSDAQRAELPVPSGAEDGEGAEDGAGTETLEDGLAAMRLHQAAAPGTPLTDADDVADPELSTEDLFDLVSWSMLLAVPTPDPPTEQTERGAATFDEIGCAKCHVPTLVGPRGAIPLYSDLLLHDMGPEMSDGLPMGFAEPSEFRTQPLWGVVVSAPFLHDGRADTLDEAIRWHGGEAAEVRDAYESLPDAEREDVIAFLESLGGKELRTSGMLFPDSPIPAAGAAGGPFRALDADEEARWLRGREIFDREFFFTAGLGPIFNGDSCRACHFDPVIGGAGPIGVNVMRHGTWEGEAFEAPEYGTIIHKLADPAGRRPEQRSAHNVFENRQTPTTFGIGAVEGIPRDAIEMLADPEDADGDGVSGRAHVFPDGRLGRFGWKAQVPNIREFIHDAMGVELGVTTPEEPGMTFGARTDSDDAADPEISLEEMDDLQFYLASLAPPAPKADPMANAAGMAAFEAAMCGACHVPELPGADGPVRAFSDFLLHDVAADGYAGIPDGEATATEFRTPPLWGISDTAPYMHDGRASTIEAAIAAHHGEATASREAFEALDMDARAALLELLEAL
jgi:CxxC motif-containing protein (DUF1111 family)